jgi:hypothetical protein
LRNADLLWIADCGSRIADDCGFDATPQSEIPDPQLFRNPQSEIRNVSGLRAFEVGEGQFDVCLTIVLVLFE